METEFDDIYKYFHCFLGWLLDSDVVFSFFPPFSFLPTLSQGIYRIKWTTGDELTDMDL